MHEENILGNTPKIPIALVLVFITKSGNPSSENQYPVFETLKNIDFH